MTNTVTRRMVAGMTALATAAGVLMGTVTSATAAPSGQQTGQHAAQPVMQSAAAGISSLTVSGHGFGHGRGMGQYGAYGYATRYNWSAAQILQRFYAGTRLVSPTGAAAGRKLTVRLTAFDGIDVRVTVPGAAFRAGGIAFPAGRIAVLRWSAATRAVTVYSTTSCTSSTMSAVARIDSGAALVYSAVSAPGNDVRKMVGACAGSVVKSYRGTVTFRSVDNTLSGRRLINTVGVDDYLRGVVPREMPASWADAAGGRGAQALRAQAIVARSYALAVPAHRPYATTCDTAACQVYGGAGSAGRLIEDARATAAVTATTGRVLVSSSGAIAKTEFSASTGGFSAGGVFPAASDAGDAVAPGNVYHSWTQRVSTAPLQARWGSEIGTLTQVRVTLRDSRAQRVVSVRLYGTNGYTEPIDGAVIAAELGLYSTWFSVTSAA